MKIAVKEWWYRKEQNKAQKYDWTLCWGNVYEKDREEKVPVRTYDLELDGSELIGMYLVGDKLKETEKAIQVILKVWNLKKAGRYITDAPVEQRWKTWIPKSALV